MKKNSSKGFTLVELLVVIAVISLLSSIILVATTGVREKARIAAIRQFSASIKHAAGHAVVGEWKFENNLDNTFGEAGPGVCSSPSCTLIYEDGIVGEAIFFNGNYSVLITNPAALGPSDDLATTIEAWVKFNNVNGAPSIFVGRNHWWLFLEQGRLKFFLQGNGCSKTVVVQNTIEAGKWYHIVVTHIPNKAIKVYLDGKEVASEGFASCYPASSSFVSIEVGSLVFNGLIEEVRIYNESYPPH